VYTEMRRLIITGTTIATILAGGGTALAANGPGRHDDSPSHLVVDDRATDTPPRPAGPSVSASPDDHGGLRDGHGADDPAGDDRGGLRGDDPAGDDHGGSRHRH
jgi:hypothetical protein